MKDLADVFEAVVGVLDRCRVCYAVMGGLAVRVYGIPRPTYDVDFTVAIEREALAEVLEALEAIGIDIPEPYRTGWLDRVADMPVIKGRCYLQAGGVDVDLFLAESAFQHSLLSRRRLVQTGNVNIWIVSPEDLVLLKLIAGRPRDLGDIENILFTQGQLDLGYLNKWSAELGVEEQLVQSLRQSDHLQE